MLIFSHKTHLYLLVFACIVFGSCHQPKPASSAQQTDPGQPTFKKVWGVSFTEVKRSFKSGYSFSDNGYQQIPEWRLSFPSDDSVNIYNPKRKLFVNAPVTFDHDSVFNVAWSYLRLKKLTKDSIIFQILKVNAKVIDNENSVVYMTLYANDYIKNVLHKDPLAMQAPTHADTLFIKKKTAEAKTDVSRAFGAVNPVQISSRTPLATIEKITNDDRSLDSDPDQHPIDYLSPEFKIVIHKAYEDFNYSFVAVVDDKGQMSFYRSMVPLQPEFKESYTKAIKGIINGYFKAYLRVSPGSTIGIPHASKIIIDLIGTRS